MDFSKTPPELVELFERVAPSGPGVGRRKMFGYPAAFVNGNLCCSLFRDQVVLRLPEEARAELLREPGCHPFEPMPGRPMTGFVAVSGGPLSDEEALRGWLRRAADWTATLPPKG